MIKYSSKIHNSLLSIRGIVWNVTMTINFLETVSDMLQTKCADGNVTPSLIIVLSL